jgi:hypothetical protein
VSRGTWSGLEAAERPVVVAGVARHIRQDVVSAIKQRIKEIAEREGEESRAFK